MNEFEKDKVAVFEQPAALINRFYVMQNGRLIRIAFSEVAPLTEGEDHPMTFPRASVVMSIDDAAALMRILEGILERSGEKYQIQGDVKSVVTGQNASESEGSN